MSYENYYWLLDQRFDFLLESFVQEYSISKEDITFIQSCHGAGRAGYKTIQVGEAEKNHITLLEPEDINRRFMAQIEPGKNALVIPFTGAYLPSEKWLECPLTTGKLAIECNNKWWQYRFFQRHGIPTPETVKLDDPDLFQSRVNDCLKRWDRIVVKRQELSGGYQMRAISHLQAFEDYLKELKQPKDLLISEFIPHSQSFAGTGVIAKDGEVYWCGATEQVLYQEFAYEGLIFPPFASRQLIKQMQDLTVRIGKKLAKLNYRGYYNVDFIFDSQALYAVEINARFGFGTLLFACSSGSDFWKAIFGEKKESLQPIGTKRLLLGKIKGRAGKRYSNLKGTSDILTWYKRKDGTFRTYFFGTEEPEQFDYGSYIGIFGLFLSKEDTREKVLKEFWKECLSEYQSLPDERKLLYMYVEDYWHFHQTGFNFDLCKRFAVQTVEGKPQSLVESSDSLKGNGWETTRFFGENISAMTLLIGENGSGKTTLMRKLIAWLCMLMDGKKPEEKGLLVFQEAKQIKYISFGGLTIRSKCNAQEMNEVEAQKLLSGITLVYYTDTMTDWGTGQKEDKVTARNLKDWSLLGQLCDNLHRASAAYQSSFVNRRSLLRRTGFIQQMRYLLTANTEQSMALDKTGKGPFFLSYLKFQLNIPEEQTEEHSGSVGGQFQDLERAWIQIMRDPNHTAFHYLVYSVVLDYLRSINLLVKNIETIDHSFLIAPMEGFLREMMIEKDRIHGESVSRISLLAKTATDLITNLKTYVNNVLNSDPSWRNRINNQLENDYQAVRLFLEAVVRLSGTGFFKLFRLESTEQENKGTSYERIWILSTKELTGESMRQDRELILSFFEAYDRVSYLIDHCWFEWLYPSSGELNSCNLYAAIHAEVQLSGEGRNGVWLFCDEPDNAFHPRWKLQTISELLTACRSKAVYVQLWLATHSPIMLSDVPGQAAILLRKTSGGDTASHGITEPGSGLFAQQIYALFQDAFFLNEGAIGHFAEHKLKEVFRDSDHADMQEMKEKCRRLLDCIKEPLLRGYLLELLKR